MPRHLYGLVAFALVAVFVRWANNPWSLCK
jgi:hypothetical protein